MTDLDQKRFWARVHIGDRDKCWEWQGSFFASGYGRIWYGTKTEGKNLRAHRLAWMFANNSPIPDGLVVMHACDNPKCCNPDHLKVGSQAENVADRDQKFRGVYHYERGVRNPQVKLTPAAVIAIKSAKGCTKVDLARRFDVGETTIRDILSGRTWGHCNP